MTATEKEINCRLDQLTPEAKSLIDWQMEREIILRLCRQKCHPGCSPGAHELAWEILRVMGDR